MTEVMSRAVIKTRTLKPLPGEITSQRINDATLPVKIEAARRAIAECTDLPELLRYKSQAEGLAAAVRTMKEVGPELIKRANEMMADAWRKGGELLRLYSNVRIASKIPIGKDSRGRKLYGQGPSDRGKVCRDLGITAHQMRGMVRLAAAPVNVAYKAAQKTRSLEMASLMVPPINTAISDRAAARKPSESLTKIMNGDRAGLNVAHTSVSKIPLDQFQHLTPDERKVVKAKITEIVELLDEMDRLCR